MKDGSKGRRHEALPEWGLGVWSMACGGRVALALHRGRAADVGEAGVVWCGVRVCGVQMIPSDSTAQHGTAAAKESAVVEAPGRVASSTLTSLFLHFNCSIVTVASEGSSN
jgi:hypothetical protein